MSSHRLSQAARDALRCPVCAGRLVTSGSRATCDNADCAIPFPVLDGIPILINEHESVFEIDDFLKHRRTFFADTRSSGFRKKLMRLLPSISRNIKSAANYRFLRAQLLQDGRTPRVLVLGGSILGEGMHELAQAVELDLVETDVSFGPRTMVICDAHNIPFADASFDCVIVQAVLEHVVDPYRCSEEIYRVLKHSGIVYAETPFMQQVHGGRFDFTRFTHLGHRRLFRRFEEIDSGSVCGPGMALAWSYQYFLLSFARSRRARAVARVVAALTSFYLKYFDSLIANTPGGLDAASGYYFYGRKSIRALSDRELMRCFRGAGT